MGKKLLTKKQIDLALTLSLRHEMEIPFDILCEYEFGVKFIDLFAYDADQNEMTGYKRVNTIVSYLYYDKEQSHLQFKLELSKDEVAFMVMVISKYKFDGNIPRENLLDSDPELTAYEYLEKNFDEAVLNS